jgi:hypothetical protein
MGQRHGEYEEVDEVHVCCRIKNGLMGGSLIGGIARQMIGVHVGLSRYD